NELLRQISGAGGFTPVQRETTDLTPADILAAVEFVPSMADDENDDDLFEDDEEDTPAPPPAPPVLPVVMAPPSRPSRPAAPRARDFELPESSPQVQALVTQVQSVGWYGLQEACDYLDFTQKTVISGLRQKGLFPEPAVQLKCGPVWIKA